MIAFRKSNAPIVRQTRSTIFRLCFIYVFLEIIFSPATCDAQQTNWEKEYPFSSLHVEAIEILNGNWYDDQGQEVSIPFTLKDKESISIQYQFELDCTPPDTLFLFLEGIGWNVGVELNEHYLGEFLHPFSNFSIPLRAEWLNEQQNTLRLQLSNRDALSFHPTPFIFLLSPPLLLDKAQKDYVSQEFLQTIEEADTVALLAPYYHSESYTFNLEEAYIVLRHLRDNEIKYVYFPFGPSKELKALCAQLGFTKVETISDKTYVCFANAYPYDPWNIPLQPQFWLDLKGGRTKYYGGYFNLNQHKFNDIDFASSMVWLVLLPLFALLIVKLLNPSFFYSLPGLLTTPKLFIDNFSDASYSNLGLVFILQFLKILSLGASSALMIFYIQQVHDWQLLVIFQENNIFKAIFNTSDSLITIFTKTSSIFFLWVVFVYLLNSLLGNIYRIKGMALGILNIDIVGSYPLVVLLVLPVSLLVFSHNQWDTSLVILLGLTLGVYGLRKLYVFYIGLDKLFSFSLGMKILYICALNIIPYMILF